MTKELNELNVLNKQKSMMKILLIIASIFITANVLGQDVEHMLDRFKKKPLKFSGDISANQVIYGTMGDLDMRRQPFTWYLMGNFNVALYGWNFPFSFSLSDQQSDYTTPPLQDFSRYGVTPYYKWIKLYAGYSNISFSPYTFNGYSMLGGGFELTPGIFNITAFYGRLNHAVEEDTAIQQEAVYKRMGYGFKTGIKKDALYCDFMFFKAADDSNSIRQPIINTETTPGENLVLGLKAGYTFLKSIKIDGEFSRTAYTRDIRSAEQTDRAPAVFANIKGLFTPRVSSQYYSAYKAGLNYLGNGYGLGFGFEHIDPGYQTMGAYYFNNDLENFTINANTSLFKQKMQLAVNFGLERNNLAQDKAATMKKTVGAVNVNYVPSPKWNLAFSYSNFSSFTNIRSNFEVLNQVDPLKPLDTLNYTQLTQSATANISYIIGSVDNKDNKQFLNLNLSSQLAANEQAGNPNSGSAFYNGILSYTISMAPRDLSLSAAINGNYTEMPNANNSMVGPVISMNKLLYKKTLRLTGSLAWNQVFQNSQVSATILNARILASYLFRKKHNFNMGLVGLQKATKLPESLSFFEYTATIGYSFSFATSDEKDKKNVVETGDVSSEM